MKDILEKIELAIKINLEFLKSADELRHDRVAFLEGRVEAYEHIKEMIEDKESK